MQTADPTDRVVPSPDHPENVEAVHGPYLVTFSLDEPSDAARSHPSWCLSHPTHGARRSRGATIIPPASLEADPVTPAPPPPTAFGWRTSDHRPPSWSALSYSLLHIVAFMARHRFALMPALIVGSILIAVMGTRRRRPRTSRPAVIGYEPEIPRRKATGALLVPILGVVAVLNVIFGTWISSLLIYHFGAEGQATITGSHSTGIVYNNPNVRQHDVLLKMADGRIVEAGFEDDDFKVYPHRNETGYPGRGDEFNVRYLLNFPQDFVILGEDDSPWAHDVRCGKLATVRSEAEQKLKFAPDVQAYRAAFNAAKQTEASAGCLAEAVPE